MIMNVQVFDQGDNAYFQWTRSNPRAFVINTTRGLDPGTMILHRATCHTIREYFGRAAPGGFTEREYIKICSIDIDHLRDWVRQNGRPDGSFPLDKIAHMFYNTIGNRWLSGFASLRHLVP